MPPKRIMARLGCMGGVVIASLSLLAAAPAQAAGACAQAKVGQDHVIRTFCDGPGVLHIAVGGRERVLRGGRCESLGALQTFNVGAVTDLSGTFNPDYVGLTVDRAGPFSNAILAVRLDGQRYRLRENHGVAGPRGGSFEGLGQGTTSKGPPVAIKGSYSC